MKKVKFNSKKAKPVYIVFTQSWHAGSSAEIHSYYNDKKKALDKANKLYDSKLNTGQNSFVLSKSEFKRKWPKFFREEYSFKS
jgi:hypothetical protein